ncbi:hypothetical protein HY573_00360 [Candidatus Parcubacteria bacterium]|nr:hypothetical protein [Candidatus Parcubacteria bacterium]
MPGAHITQATEAPEVLVVAVPLAFLHQQVLVVAAPSDKAVLVVMELSRFQGM